MAKTGPRSKIARQRDRVIAAQVRAARERDVRAERDAEETREARAQIPKKAKGQQRKLTRKIARAVRALPEVLSTSSTKIASQLAVAPNGAAPTIRATPVVGIQIRSLDTAGVADLRLQARALKWRSIGYDYPEIARRLRIEVTSAEALVQAALQRTIARMIQDAPHALALELTALAQLQVACWGQAKRGSPDHVNAILRIIDMRARLLGLGKTRVEHTGLGGAPLAESRLVTLARMAGADLDRGPVIDVGDRPNGSSGPTDLPNLRSESAIGPPAVIEPPSTSIDDALSAAIRGYQGN